MSIKYELLKDQSINFDGRILYRICALKDFSDVKKGDIGGFVQSENNLSHEGNCWIYEGSIVCDTTRIYDDAIIQGNIVIYGNTLIGGNIGIGKKSKITSLQIES